jgi:hypothetical protein
MPRPPIARGHFFAVSSDTETDNTEMPLPQSRDITATAASAVPSNTFNVIQDCIIGGKHGTKTLWLPPMSRVANDTNITFTNGYAFASAPAAAMNYVALPMDEGSRIVGLRARVKGTGLAGNIVVNIVRWRGDVVEAIVGTMTIVSPANAWVEQSGAIGPIDVQAGDYAYWLRCTLALVNQGIVAFGVDYYRP